MIRTLALLAAIAVSLPALARADTQRLAIIVGNNAGTGRAPALRFAQRDAERMADVLVEVGGLARADIELLRGASAGELRGALQRVRARVATIQAGATRNVVLLFYFSGHSDGQALELGPDLVRFSEVRGWLEATGAAVRLVILDSCRSGGLLALKGGTLGPAFDVRLADNMSSTGEAVITSSAARESALESAEIGASFFSHHLISGLRGAADTSGDGLVTLGEAYQYAFARTVNATADTTIGPQHPGYDYRLSGRGELVLTRISAASGVLQVPAGFDRFLVTASVRQDVVAEIDAAGARRLAVPPGDYAIRAWRGQQAFAAHARVSGSRSVALAAGDFVEVSLQSARSKGEPDGILTAPARRRPRLSLGAGLTGGVGEATPWLPALARGLGTPGGRWTLALTGATARADGVRESQFQLRAGALWRWGNRLGPIVGLEAGGGLAEQSLPGRPLLWSGLVTASPVAGVAWALPAGQTLTLALRPAVTALRRDQRLHLLFLPGLWLEAAL